MEEITNENELFETETAYNNEGESGFNFTDNDFAEDTTPKSKSEDTDTGFYDSDAIPNDENEPRVLIKYNHREKSLSIKEAAEQIQKNMYAESSIEKLKFMAAHKGVTLPELVNDIFEKNECEEIGALKEKFAEDDEGFLGALRERQKYNESCFMEMLKAEETPNTNMRLADEFYELCGLFPETESIEDIPEEVFFEAATTGKSLVNCFLINKVKEITELNEALNKKIENITSSLGSVGSNETAGENPEILAMLKGIAK